ncbi:hypothetical protein Tsubulata_034036, partial [Turnera subulata]
MRAVSDATALSKMLNTREGLPWGPSSGNIRIFLASEEAFNHDNCSGEEALYARVELPGSYKEGVKLWVRSDHIYASGLERDISIPGAEAKVALCESSWRPEAFMLTFVSKNKCMFYLNSPVF